MIKEIESKIAPQIETSQNQKFLQNHQFPTCIHIACSTPASIASIASTQRLFQYILPQHP